MNLSDPLELQGSSLYTVGRNGLVTSYVVPTGSEPTSTYTESDQLRETVSGGIGMLLILGIIFMLLFMVKR